MEPRMEHHLVMQREENLGFLLEPCLGCHWGCCLEIDWDQLWGHCLGFGMGSCWESQRAERWEMRREQSWDSRKENHWELQWEEHLVWRRGCQMEQSWAPLLAGCLGFHWDCCWVSGWVLMWGIGLGSVKGLH